MTRNIFVAALVAAVIILATFIGCSPSDKSSQSTKTDIKEATFAIEAVQDTPMSDADIAEYEQQKAAEAAEAARIQRYSKFQVGDYSDTLMVGDSIMVLSSWSLEDYLPGITIDACSGRSMESGGVAEGGGSGDGVLDHIRALDPSSYSRYVVGTGNNNGSGMQYEDGLEIVNTLGSDCEIWFVTELVTNNSTGTANTNATIAQLAEEFDNVRVIDWYAAVSPAPSRYLADNCHPGTQEARDMYAGLVKEGLDSVVI